MLANHIQPKVKLALPERDCWRRMVCVNRCRSVSRETVHLFKMRGAVKCKEIIAIPRLLDESVVGTIVARENDTLMPSKMPT
jgi:predicted amidophosphoribosyltransferase